ncbi:MAG TPA: mobilization protein [Polyangia bacterium]|nr:mobilization protein [Polyangia bacterium]
MSTIHFIGGEKGGVGKSVVARVCAQYCIDRELPFTAADADGSHGALMRFYANYTTPVDLTSFPSADQILGFATDADRRVLVDLPAQSDRLLGAWLGESGILEIAAESDVRVVFWHVIDDGKDALITLERLLNRTGDQARICIVKNHGRGKDFTLFDRSPVREAAQRLGAAVLELPELNPAVMQKIDRLDASFWAAANGSSFGTETFSRIERQRVKVWLTAVYDRITQLGDVF